MNKLQKLFENGVRFQIVCTDEYLDWTIYSKNGQEKIETKFGLDFNFEIEQLWQAAKKHYPDAACFKEESNG